MCARCPTVSNSIFHMDSTVYQEHIPILRFIQQKISLSDAETDFITSSFTVLKKKKHDFILKQGHKADHLYFLSKGYVRLFRVDEKVMKPPPIYWYPMILSLLSKASSTTHIPKRTSNAPPIASFCALPSTIMISCIRTLPTGMCSAKVYMKGTSSKHSNVPISYKTFLLQTDTPNSYIPSPTSF